ncbi:hypothetical protein D0C16_05795 [Cellvibrio sp. KY-GH-1]|nr:hypothetical protein D0C16_05795 [Cellvibrio sp. KY-GH-1]
MNKKFSLFIHMNISVVIASIFNTSIFLFAFKFVFPLLVVVFLCYLVLGFLASMLWLPLFLVLKKIYLKIQYIILCQQRLLLL